MTSTELEGRVRDVLARQAASLEPPHVRPDDALVVEAAHDTQPRHGRILVAAAAAALLALAGIAIANRNSDTSAGSTDDGSASSFHYATGQVQLDAASIKVEAGGRTFVPPANVSVHSDPGTWNQYTTLELEWDAGGVPMRIYIYFASDGTDWWATEMRTYDGSAGGEWIEMTGEYFRSPLGTAYQGDVDVSSLHMHGLKLLAFPRPLACTNARQAARDRPRLRQDRIGGRAHRRCRLRGIRRVDRHNDVFAHRNQRCDRVDHERQPRYRQRRSARSGASCSTRRRHPDRIGAAECRNDHGSRGGLRQGNQRAHRSGRHSRDRERGYLIASAFGGVATPCGTLSGADTNRQV